jgi:hypothetical protein
MEEIMAGILDFLKDVGENPTLSSEFVTLAAKPDVTQRELLAFFRTKNYGDVTDDDVNKIMVHRNNIETDFNVPPHQDY